MSCTDGVPVIACRCSVSRNSFASHGAVASCASLAAEAHLKGHEHFPGFSLMILRVVEMPATPTELRLSASVLFKNFVKVHAACLRCLAYLASTLYEHVS